MPEQAPRPLFDVPLGSDIGLVVPVPRMTLAEQGDAAVAKILAAKPSKFTVGAHSDGKGVVASTSYDRKWSNGWGATAYAKAWWNDASVTPGRTSGAMIGAEGSYEFRPK